MKVLCIDDTKKPETISDSEWIQEGTVYTVTSVAFMGLQNGRLGYKLKEIKLLPESFPYEYYDAERFILIITDEKKAEAIKEEASVNLKTLKV